MTLTFRDNDYHPERLAEALRAEIDCYACGLGYQHLGDGVHEGRCPRCHSSAVSPAGPLNVLGVDVDPELASEGVDVVTVDARDRGGREYRFMVEVAGDTGRLRAVEFPERRVRANSPYWDSGLRYDAVEQVVGEYIGDQGARLLVEPESDSQ